MFGDRKEAAGSGGINTRPKRLIEHTTPLHHYVQEWKLMLSPLSRLPLQMSVKKKAILFIRSQIEMILFLFLRNDHPVIHGRSN